MRDAYKIPQGNKRVKAKNSDPNNTVKNTVAENKLIHEERYISDGSKPFFCFADKEFGLDL